MKRYTQNLYLLFDNDPAGFDATVRALKIAYEQDSYPKILRLPEGFKDVDEWANISPSEEQINSFFAGAEDGVLYILTQLLAKYDDNSPIERKRIIEQMFGILLYIQDLTVLAWYFEKISERLKISHDILKQQYTNFTKTQSLILKNIEKNKEQKPVKQADELSFASFFYQDFLEKMNISSSKLEEVVKLVGELAVLLEDQPLSSIFGGTVDADLKEQLLETQLFWERQRDTHTDDKKQMDVLVLGQKYIQQAMQRLMKYPKISAEQKQQLLAKMHKIFLGK